MVEGLWRKAKEHIIRERSAKGCERQDWKGCDQTSRNRCHRWDPLPYRWVGLPPAPLAPSASRSRLSTAIGIKRLRFEVGWRSHWFEAAWISGLLLLACLAAILV